MHYLVSFCFSSENGHVGQYCYNIAIGLLSYPNSLYHCLIVSYILTITDLKAAQHHIILPWSTSDVAMCSCPL